MNLSLGPLRLLAALLLVMIAGFSALAFFVPWIGWPVLIVSAVAGGLIVGMIVEVLVP